MGRGFPNAQELHSCTSTERAYFISRASFERKARPGMQRNIVGKMLTLPRGCQIFWSRNFITHLPHLTSQHAVLFLALMHPLYIYLIMFLLLGGGGEILSLLLNAYPQKFVSILFFTFVLVLIAVGRSRRYCYNIHLSHFSISHLGKALQFSLYL
jgi:hypothetical protein